MRERLIELIRESHCVDTWNHYTDDFKEPNPIEELADLLLANGIIVPPCKVGQTVYHICKSNQEIEQGKIESISYWDDGYFLFSLDKGEYSIGIGGDEIFLTKEEAEVENKCNYFKNKADFVEVVRCKDCKHYERPSIEEDNYFCMAEHTQRLYSPNKNDFCSYGERRDT